MRAPSSVDWLPLSGSSVSTVFFPAEQPDPLSTLEDPAWGTTEDPARGTTEDPLSTLEDPAWGPTEDPPSIIADPATCCPEEDKMAATPAAPVMGWEEEGLESAPEATAAEEAAAPEATATEEAAAPEAAIDSGLPEEAAAPEAAIDSGLPEEAAAPEAEAAAGGGTELGS